MKTRSRRRSYPAQALAESRIRSLLEGGGPIPGMKQIAAQAGVSLVSVWSAAQRMKEAGEITIRPRAGIRRADDGKSPATAGLDRSQTSPGERSAKWRRVARRMRIDLLTGELDDGGRRLSAKQMSVRYACSYRTVRKAIAEIESITGPSVTHAPARRAQHSIVLIAWGYDDGRMRHLNPWSAIHLRVLERECVRAGTCLRVVTFGEDNREPFYLDRPGGAVRQLPGGDEVLGYCLWTMGSQLSVRRAFDDARAGGHPVAVLDEDGAYDPAPLVRMHRLARAFSFSTGASPAGHLAHYLARIGHRRIAFVSGLHRALWSRLRLEGLRQVFDDSRNGRAVTPYTFDGCRDIEEYGADQTLEPAVVSALSDALGRGPFRRGLTRVTAGRIAARIAQGSDMIMHQESLGAALDPLFAEALADTGTTAWVCAHDDVALAALRYLRQRGVDVPGRISVVSFDDSAEALGADLTSVNFNIEGLAHAMVTHILRPGFTPKGPAPIEVDAVVMVRGSSANA